MPHTTHSNSKVVFITGASSGIGKACAYDFYRHGYAVVLFARRKNRLDAICEELKKLRPDGHVLVIAGSVTDRTRVFEAVNIAVEKLGRIDVLVNNAGAGLNAFFEATDPKAFRDILDLNVMGVFHCMQAVIPVMKHQQSGQIVNVSSIIGRLGIPARSAYCTSKFALEGLSESLRTELLPYGIIVTVVRPTTTDTEFFDAEPRGLEYMDTSGGPPRMSAGKAARLIYGAVKKRKRTVTISFLGKFTLFLNTVAPQMVDRIVTKMFGKLKKQK
ncbi:MAG: SDR family NAD(P)-dependent oxidoreductase [Candidatus Omnitrophica bacterium]|nr:SDR family NAD(P)-dependent oxidoreductase [Candidatus Omnitrophota bacterium]